MPENEMGLLAFGADAVEVNPVKYIDNKGTCEQCEESEADFFSVYFHSPTKGLECVADLPNEAEANILASKLAKEYNLKF